VNVELRREVDRVLTRAPGSGDPPLGEKSSGYILVLKLELKCNKKNNILM
jgi:hypothetical protein